MTKNDWIRLYAFLYVIKEPVKGRDPVYAVREANYFVNRVLELTPEPVSLMMDHPCATIASFKKPEPVKKKGKPQKRVSSPSPKPGS